MSDPEFPTYSKAARTGDKGVRLVQRIVADQLGWIFKELPGQKDLGIDAHIELLGEDGKALGRLIAVQIKCGESFFRKRDKEGFVFYGDKKQLNYFLNYSLPVILVLCHPTKDQCWWCEIEPLETEQTRRGWKITVPFGQVFDIRAKVALIELAGLAQNYLPEMEQYWFGNRLLSEPFKLYHIIIAREDIESGDISRVLEILRRFYVTKKIAKKSQELMDFSVDGYDDDPRELFEIPEVRAWFRKLDQEYRYWFYFLSKQTHALSLVTLCLCTYEKVPGVGVRITDKKELAEFVAARFVAMNEMCAFVGLSEAEIEKLSDGVISYFHPEYEAYKKASGSGAG